MSECAPTAPECWPKAAAEAQLRDERSQGAVPFAVGVGEERGVYAELLLNSLACLLKVFSVCRVVVLPHASVRGAVIADSHASLDQLAELVPAHDARVTQIDRIGGDEHGEREACILESRPRLLEGRARCIVDGDADGAIRQRPAGVKRGKNLRNRKHGVTAGRKVLDVRLELLDGDARRRVRVLAESVILQDDSRISGECRAGAGRNRGGHRAADAYGAEEPAEVHEAINPVPAAESQSKG